MWLQLDFYCRIISTTTLRRGITLIGQQLRWEKKHRICINIKKYRYVCVWESEAMQNIYKIRGRSIVLTYHTQSLSRIKVRVNSYTLIYTYIKKYITVVQKNYIIKL